MKTEKIELKPMSIKTATIHIVGDGDLILNKMNDVNRNSLIDQRKDKAKAIEKKNEWEEVITAIHWLHGNPKEFSKESMEEKLTSDAPCLTAFGLKKSFGQSVVRLGYDTYSTKFDASVNIVAKGDNLVPIKFAEWHLDEKLMSPKRGAPVLVRLNRFSGWSADITISYLDSVYSLEQIVNFINSAGFGIGIGSGRSSGYGRYHVENVQ